MAALFGMFYKFYFCVYFVISLTSLYECFHFVNLFVECTLSYRIIQHLAIHYCGIPMFVSHSIYCNFS